MQQTDYKFLEALFTMLFIELYVHDPHKSGDAELCAEDAWEAAKVAGTWLVKKAKEGSK
jgi:hypothetical protein